MLQGNKVVTSSGSFSFDQGTTSQFKQKFDSQQIVLLERSVYYDIFAGGPFLVKRSRMLPEKMAMKDRLEVDMKWADYHSQKLFQELDDHAHQRVLEAAKLPKFTKLVGWRFIDEPDFVRTDVRLEFQFLPKGIEFVMDRENRVPMHKTDLSRLSLEQIDKIELNVKDFISRCAVRVINEGCFLIGSDLSLSYHKLEHFEQVPSTENGMKIQLNALIKRLKKRRSTSDDWTMDFYQPDSVMCQNPKTLFGSFAGIDLQDIVPLSAGKYGTTFLTSDSKFVVKVIPIPDENVTKLSLNQMAEFHQEVVNCKFLLTKNLTQYVAKPIVAMILTCTGDKYETYDNPFVVMQNEPSRSCCGFIVTEHFKNSTTAFKYLSKNRPNIRKLAKDLYHVCMYFVSKTGYFHSDFHLSNILVRPGQEQDFHYKHHSWKSLPLEYLIIDFGQIGTVSIEHPGVVQHVYDPTKDFTTQQVDLMMEKVLKQLTLEPLF